MWKFSFGKKSESADRKERFETEVAINFRKVGEYAWSMGKISNVSRSGVLFRAVNSIGPSTPLEMEFVAPTEFGKEAGQLVACRGKVVRMFPPPPDDRRATMAATFTKFQIVPRPGEW
jgi:hypothetical protein